MRKKKYVMDARGAAHVEYVDEPDPLAGLAFTSAARSKAEALGHTADMYEGIDPDGFGGEYLVEQVQEVESCLS